MEAPETMTVQMIFETMNTFGIAGVLVLFVAYMLRQREAQDKARAEDAIKQQQVSLDRENKLGARIDSVETYTRTTLLEALNRSSTVLQQNNDVLRSLPCRDFSEREINNALRGVHKEG